MKTVTPPVMVKRYYQVNPRDIAIVQFIIEGYDGMATVTTVDSRRACLEVSIITAHLDDFERLADDLKETYALKEMPCS